MRIMQTEIEQLRAELVYYRVNSATPFEELQSLKHKISLMEASNTKLKRELLEQRIRFQHLSKRAINVQNNAISEYKMHLSREPESYYGDRDTESLVTTMKELVAPLSAESTHTGHKFKEPAIFTGGCRLEVYSFNIPVA